MKTSVRSLTVVSAFAFLAACGGGGGGSVPSLSQPSSQSGPASLRFFVPSALTPASRGAKSLPATTQSVQIMVTSGTTTPLATAIAPFVFNVSATAPGCSSVSGGISCMESVTVPFGASLLFSITAFAGQNATGAELAIGSSAATIGATTTGVTVTMNAQNIYVGGSLSGGMGSINIDHAAGTFTVNDSGGSITGSVSTLPGNPDFLKFITATPANSQGQIVYARELPGSMMLFASTGSSTPQASGQSGAAGGDMGAGVAAQGCPISGYTTPVSIADVPGPAWVPTSPAYTSGTATVSVASGVATVNFSGNKYDANGNVGQAQSGSQTCANGVFSATNQGAVVFSPDGVTVVTNGTNANVSPTDVDEGGLGFAQPATPATTAAISGTFTGFLGGFSVNGTTITKNEAPVSVTALSSSTLQGCLYANFEGGTLGTNCAQILIGPATNQPGVYLASIVTPPSTTPANGIVTVGKTSSGKYAIFATFAIAGQTSGGQFIELIQH